MSSLPLLFSAPFSYLRLTRLHTGWMDDIHILTAGMNYSACHLTLSGTVLSGSLTHDVCSLFVFFFTLSLQVYTSSLTNLTTSWYWYWYSMIVHDCVGFIYCLLYGLISTSFLLHKIKEPFKRRFVSAVFDMRSYKKSYWFFFLFKLNS